MASEIREGKLMQQGICGILLESDHCAKKRPAIRLLRYPEQDLVAFGKAGNQTLQCAAEVLLFHQCPFKLRCCNGLHGR